jgi:hypothetical protein
MAGGMGWVVGMSGGKGRGGGADGGIRRAQGASVAPGTREWEHGGWGGWLLGRTAFYRVEGGEGFAARARPQQWGRRAHGASLPRGSEQRIHAPVHPTGAGPGHAPNLSGGVEVRWAQAPPRALAGGHKGHHALALEEAAGDDEGITPHRGPRQTSGQHGADLGRGHEVWVVVQ